MTHIRRYETTGRPVFITVVLHRRIPYLKNLVGQVAPQALPDAYETTWNPLPFNDVGEGFIPSLRTVSIALNGDV